MKNYIYYILIILTTLSFACKKELPIEPPPPSDTVSNTINLTVEWTDLYRINVKWNKSIKDTLEPFTYRLTQINEQGNKTTRDFMMAGKDTNYTAGEPDSLVQGKSYWFKVEGYNKEGKLKDTSKTVEGKTLTITNQDFLWQLDTLGQPGDLLYDVWGLDENNVYAVGAINMHEGITSIIKWDGQKWNYHSWPEGGASSIYGFSKNDIWIVGEYSNRGFIGHFNGTTWTEYRSDYFLSRGDTVYQLYAVWGSAPNDVWAVGAEGTIVHWNGIEWKKVPSPTTRILTDIWGSAPNNIYAIGFSLMNQAEIIHYDGIKWNNITSELNTTTRGFRSVWVDKSRKAYAVGTNVIHFNGQRWSTVNINQSRFLTRIRGRNSSDIVAVGQRGRIHHFNGLEWKTYPQLYRNTGPLTELRGVIIFEKLLIGVGISYDRGALVYIGKRN